jgi:6,7-dimethyl-8-ribityllumazine synthase
MPPFADTAATRPGHTRSDGGRRIALAVARYRPEITTAMLQTARRHLLARGIAEEDLHVWYAPGSFELPLLAQALASSGRYQAIICLGCVMKGETRHDVLVSDAAAQGIQRVALESGLPVIFGVICAESLQQAEARIPRAAECAEAALEMLHTLREISRLAESEATVQQTRQS